MLDGSNATPVIRDFILSTAAAHKVGDLMVIETDGDLTQAATNGDRGDGGLPGGGRGGGDHGGHDQSQVRDHHAQSGLALLDRRRARRPG